VIDVNEDERTSSQWAVVIFLIMKFMMMCHCLTTINASFIGATENARHEFAAPDCKGGKCKT